MLDKTLRIGQLADYYGALLTARQRELIRLYYYENLSLGEIGERCNISRQAVHDHLQRAEKALEEFESKLNLLQKEKALRDGLRALKEKFIHLQDESARELIALVENMERIYGGDWSS